MFRFRSEVVCKPKIPQHVVVTVIFHHRQAAKLDIANNHVSTALKSCTYVFCMEVLLIKINVLGDTGCWFFCYLIKELFRDSCYYRYIINALHLHFRLTLDTFKQAHLTATAVFTLHSIESLISGRETLRCFSYLVLMSGMWLRCSPLFKFLFTLFMLIKVETLNHSNELIRSVILNILPSFTYYFWFWLFYMN